MLPTVCKSHSTRGIVSQFHRQRHAERTGTSGDGAAYDAMLAKMRVSQANLKDAMVEYVGGRLMGTP